MTKQTPHGPALAAICDGYRPVSREALIGILRDGIAESESRERVVRLLYDLALDLAMLRLYDVSHPRGEMIARCDVCQREFRVAPIRLEHVSEC
ncbi:MAG: hypothetical protein NAOJABEB_02963 [Steroidobacteraceae bacterium]|nr:hypothetical protein [Steroidobacteraceae bacterium]